MAALKAKTTRRDTEAKTAALAVATKEDKTPVNMLIPASLHQRLKIHAATAGKGITVTSTVIAAVEAYLDEHE